MVGKMKVPVKVEPLDITKIEDPLQGIDYCNKQMGRIEKRLSADEEMDPKTFNNLTYNLREWTELLQKFIHQAYQQGKTKTDITQATSKTRFNA